MWVDSMALYRDEKMYMVLYFRMNVLELSDVWFVITYICFINWFEYYIFPYLKVVCQLLSIQNLIPVLSNTPSIISMIYVFKVIMCIFFSLVWNLEWNMSYCQDILISHFTFMFSDRAAMMCQICQNIYYSYNVI